jgi:hypothetical protein
LLLPELEVTELAVQISIYDLLIGLDVILKYKLTNDGPARTFTITF